MQNEWLKSILGEFQGYINEVKQNAQAQGINADFLDLQDGVLNHKAVVGEENSDNIKLDNDHRVGFIMINFDAQTLNIGNPYRLWLRDYKYYISWKNFTAKNFNFSNIPQLIVPDIESDTWYMEQIVSINNPISGSDEIPLVLKLKDTPYGRWMLERKEYEYQVAKELGEDYSPMTMKPDKYKPLGLLALGKDGEYENFYSLNLSSQLFAFNRYSYPRHVKIDGSAVQKWAVEYINKD